jgi:hypothetical protein
LLIAGRSLTIRQAADCEPGGAICPSEVCIRHCTLVPGWGLNNDCEPRHSAKPSLELFNVRARVSIEHSIVGSIEINEDAVRSEPLDQYRFIHFAVHGHYDEDQPSRSGIALSVAADSRQDGILLGGSSGTSLAAAFQYAQRCKPEDMIVVLCADTGRNYLSKMYDDTWMARKFFSGGTMPSDRLFLNFGRDLAVTGHWRLSGTHYARTAEAWLTRMDRNKTAILEVLAKEYGRGQARAWWENWRVFFLACAELWGYRNGKEWLVSHYLFERKQRT